MPSTLEPLERRACVQGVYYGAFTGEGRDALGAPSDLWVVSRPHNWHPKSSKEYLLHLSLETGGADGCAGAGPAVGCWG